MQVASAVPLPMNLPILPATTREKEEEDRSREAGDAHTNSRMHPGSEQYTTLADTNLFYVRHRAVHFAIAVT